MMFHFVAPVGLPSRYDPLKPAPFLQFLKEQKGPYRVISADGVLMPNFAAALEIPTPQYINALTVEWYHRFRVDHLQTDRLFESSSDVLWFTGRPELTIDREGRGVLSHRWIGEDLKANLVFYSLMGVRYILIPHDEDLNARANPRGPEYPDPQFPLIYNN